MLPNSATAETRQQQDSNSKRRSRGISVNTFYRPDATTKQLHQEIQSHVVDYQSNKLLNLQTIQRKAFHSLSVYKTYPLQELAVSKLQELRVAWGAPEPLSSEDTLIQRTYSADSTSSLEPDPEANRLFRG